MPILALSSIPEKVPLPVEAYVVLEKENGARNQNLSISSLVLMLTYLMKRNGGLNFMKLANCPFFVGLVY